MRWICLFYYYVVVIIIGFEKFKLGRQKKEKGNSQVIGHYALDLVKGVVVLLIPSQLKAIIYSC